MAATVEEVISALEMKRLDVREHGQKWKAQCPSHEDKQASLSIAKGDNGKALLKCFAGCDYTKIMSDLGLSNGHVGSNGANGDSKKMASNGAVTERPKPEPLGRVVATYEYRAADGQLLYKKLRYQPKTFRVVGANGKWGLNGATPTLYNSHLLPELDADTPVFVVEGEKDADNLLTFLDIVAVCNYDGAGKWLESYTNALANRHVVIIPDNDVPGEKHAEMVAAAVAPHATSTKILRLPDLPTHGDVSDWLQRKAATPELLWEMVEAAAVLPKPTEKPKDFEVSRSKTEDYRAAMRWLGYSIKFNELTGGVELNGRPIDKVREATLRSQVHDLGFKGVARMNDALLVESDANRYHPIKNYLNGLVWDGQDHIGRLFSHYLDESTGFGETAWRRWMIGAVAKVLASAQNAMMVWDGGQDVGKSHLARWLCPLPDYYIEAQLNPDDKDSLVRLATKWLWEVPEVDATTRRAEVAALKDFITRDVITVRRAYDQYDMVQPACASLIGTINNDGSGFLRDATGNRRFLTINIRSLDWAYSQDLDPNQLWAQAVSLFRSGESHRLTAAEREMRDHINRQYQTQNYLEVLFDSLFEVRPERKDQFWSAEAILKELELNGLKGNQNQNLKELKVYLHKLGATAIRPRMADGSRPTSYTGVMNHTKQPA